MANFITCGAYDSGNGFSDIHVDTVTGDVILDSDLLGKVYMAELAVLDPIVAPDIAVIEKICNYFSCDGVIMSHRNLITLKDNVAEYRDYANNSTVLKTIVFNTDMEANVVIDCD